MKKRIIEIAVKVIVAALTAFLTAISTTSCLGINGALYLTAAGIKVEAVAVTNSKTTVLRKGIACPDNGYLLADCLG